MASPRDQNADELRQLADEQAALRRVATLVARGARSTAVFTTVAEEVGVLFGVDATAVIRFEPDGEATLLGARGQTRRETGARFTPDPRLAIASVRATGRAARIDANGQDSVPDILGTPGIRSVVDVPIVLEGRVWGALGVAARRGPLPPDTERRLTDFAELVATAIGNAQAREELRKIADEQAALRQVATLIARGEPSPALFSAVAEEVGVLFGVDATAVIRFEPDDQATLLGARGQTRRETGARFTPDPRLAIASIRATGRAARIDANGQDNVPDILGTPGIRSVVDVPIVLEGRVWGALGVAARRGPLPPDTERRLTDFAELVATAIGNAQAHGELTASRARIVTTADQTRRRIERDLHDGTQQQLVSLRLQLKTVQASVPPELDQLAADLDHLAAGLTDALDQLREIARGIHPAILAEGGLGPAVKALVRRSPVPVDLTVRLDEQLSEPVEVGAYYVVSEALTNVAKHARALAITVAVEASGGVLRILVRDDGAGGADFTRGTGLQGLKDRVEALSGRFSLHSAHGAGTTLRAEFPLTSTDGLTPGSGPVQQP